MNKVLKEDKTEPKHKPKYKQTEYIRNPEAYFKSKLKWKPINDGQTKCPTCLLDLQEDEAMETPRGQRVHEACYEPGESNH